MIYEPGGTNRHERGHMALLEGQYINNYYLHKHIGRGGYADVYRCTHKNTRIEYAIKVAQQPLDQEKIQLFLNEVELHAQMQHPFIVKVFDFDSKHDFFLVMEYVPYGSLSRLCGQQTELAIILPYIKQAAEALDYMHQKQIVHRDIKPENLLLGANNTILLCDFGIAVRTTQTIKSTYGTLEYVAPEQLRRQPCPASDQYALAITVYQWITGELPFDNKADILATPVPSLRQKLPTIAQEVENVILKALMKEPQQRYPTVSAFAAALEQAYLRSTATAPAATRVTPSLCTVLNKTRIIGSPITVVLPASKVTLVLPTVRVGGGVSSLCVYQKHAQDISALAWSPDGKQIASADIYNAIHLWNALNGHTVSTLQGGSRMILNMLWSADGTCLAVADEVQAVHFWDIKTGKKLFRYQHRVGKPDEIGIGFYYPMAWSRDGRFMVSASDDQPLEKWDTTTGQRLLTYTEPTGTIKALAWSPDETKVAFGSSDTLVRIWNVTNGNTEYIYQGHRREITGLCWSPDGKRIASVGADGLAHVWNAVNGHDVRIYHQHRPYTINTIAWSPDGTKIASAGDDKQVHIWDAQTGQTLETYDEHIESVSVVRWSPTGEYVASASNDGTVRVWQAPV